MSSYPSEEGIVEYFEGLVEYMRKLGYEDPRDKRIAELEDAIRKHRDTVATLLAVFEGDDRAETCEEDNQLWAVLGGDDVN